MMVFLWVLCTAMMGFMAFFYYQMDLVYIIYNMLQETGQSPREIDIVMKSIYESYFANIFVYYAEWVVALFCCFFILITFVVELCLVLCKPERYYGREISWGFGTPASDHKSFNSWLRAQKAAAQSRPVSRHQHGTGNIYSIADPSKEEGLYSGRSTAQAMGEGHIAPADSMQSVQLASPHHPRVLASATVGPGERLV